MTEPKHPTSFCELYGGAAAVAEGWSCLMDESMRRRRREQGLRELGELGILSDEELAAELVSVPRASRPDAGRASRRDGMTRDWLFAVPAFGLVPLTRRIASRTG